MNAYLVIKPVITEKSLKLAATQNTYSFWVERTAAKKQIQEAIEKMYNVSVLSVNTVRGHRSSKATGRRRIKRTQAQPKKALVMLKQGDKIALFDLTA